MLPVLLLFCRSRDEVVDGGGDVDGDDGGDCDDPGELILCKYRSL